MGGAHLVVAENILQTSTRQDWPVADHLTGREPELEQLDELLQQALAGHGTTVFLEAITGMGKSVLLGGLRRRTRAKPSLGSVSFIRVNCLAAGPDSAYEAFNDLLEQIVKSDRLYAQREWAQRVLKIFTAVGPDLLGLIPGVGSALKSPQKLGRN